LALVQANRRFVLVGGDAGGGNHPPTHTSGEPPPLLGESDAAERLPSRAWRVRREHTYQQTDHNAGEKLEKRAESGKEAALPPLPPLRTVRESLPSHGSSISNALRNKTQFPNSNTPAVNLSVAVRV
jgi:hypothetical protein